MMCSNHQIKIYSETKNIHDNKDGVVTDEEHIPNQCTLYINTSVSPMSPISIPFSYDLLKFMKLNQITPLSFKYHKNLT
jgi:hypothetical protein